jgi:hypothetical protein
MPLKIYFCDACNESIPLKDLHSNRITFDAGKIFCAGCAPRRTAAVARIGAGAAIGVLGFAAMVGLAFLGGRELQRAAGESAAATKTAGRLEAELNRLRADAFTRAECERLLAPILESAEKVKSALSALDERVRALDERSRGAAQKVERDLAAVAKDLADARAATERAGKTATESAQAAAALKSALDALAAKSEELTRVLNAVVEKGSASPAASAGGAGAAPTAPADPEEAELRRLAALLKESDAGRRYEAVNGLANLHAAGAVEALEVALGDPESYVRDAAVRALRRHASLKSVPKIIGALRDADLFVRTSAKAALKQLVGVEPAFDPDADAARRERGVKEFETWWAANAEKFLGK